MRVLTVAPLTSGIPYEELSYFAKDEVNAGDLVEITIKRRVCRALVLDAQNAEEDRQSLRQASFNIKKMFAHSKPALGFSIFLIPFTAFWTLRNYTNTAKLIPMEY